MYERVCRSPPVRRELAAYFDKSSFKVAIRVAPSKAVSTLLARMRPVYLLEFSVIVHA